LNFSLLVDVDGKIADAYGVRNGKNFLPIGSVS